MVFLKHFRAAGETASEGIENYRVYVDPSGCDVSCEASQPPLAPPPRAGGVGAAVLRATADRVIGPYWWPTMTRRVES